MVGNDSKGRASLRRGLRRATSQVRLVLPRIATLLTTALLATACSGFPTVGDPIGDPQLPDLVPEPPVDLRVSVEDGVTMVRFSSTLVNVGEGDFVLRAEREGEVWSVDQEIWYSEGGGELIDTDAEMVWGGDGHEHWHIKRVANYRLVALDASGEPVDEDLGYDTKIGFCFYDSSHAMGFGPEKEVYELHQCGHEDDTAVRMGMSVGWSDVYGFSLPGQSIEITGLDDGFYRVWAEADTAGWFEEATRENNTTWIDFELLTVDGKRFARLDDIGPEPGD